MRFVVARIEAADAIYTQISRFIVKMCKWAFRDANLTQCDFDARISSCSVCLGPNYCTREGLNTATSNAVRVATYY